MARFPKPETHVYLGGIHRAGRHFDVYLGLDERYTVVLRGKRRVIGVVESFPAIEKSIAEHLTVTEGECGSPSVSAGHQSLCQPRR